MALEESITAAMNELKKISNVTHNSEERNQPRVIDMSELTKEEKEFYKTLFGDDIAAVRHRKLHCTACDIHIGSAPSQYSNMFAHPVLLTLLCAECRRFYGDGNFEQGEDATDMFCRWCANGGNLYCCSYCSNTFCDKCIKRNFDPVVRKKIEDEEKWKCFVCDPTDLYTARAVCWALSQHVQTVTRILKNDKTITEEDYTEKMNLDESKCCSRKRSGKVKRRRLSAVKSDNEEDETYHPGLEELSSSSSSRRRSTKRSPRNSLVINGDEDRSSIPITRRLLRPKTELENYEDEDEDEDLLPPPMIPCVQSMVEGENSDALNETIINAKCPTPPPPTLHINPIPTANLLRVIQPPMLTPMKMNPAKRKRRKMLQHILPSPKRSLLMVKNPAPQNSSQNQNLRKIQFGGSLNLRAQTRPPNSVPMVSLPNNNNSKSPNTRLHTIEYSSLPLRVPIVQAGGIRQTISPRITVQNIKLTPSSSSSASSALNSVKEVGVIEIGSDSDDPDCEELVDSNKDKETDVNNSLCTSRDILKYMLNKRFQDKESSDTKKKEDKTNNKVEEEIDTRTDEVRTLFRMIGTKLRKVPLLHLPNHNNLRSTRVKTRRFHLAITKAISTLSDINDKVISKYSNWRKTMIEESAETKSSDDSTADTANETTTNDKDEDNDKNKDDVNIPLDMICTNSESESDNNDEYDSDSMLIGDKGIIGIKTFQERDTVDVCIGDRVSTADKSVQAFDVVERDYEKCIGHSVLTKVEYDPIDGSEILRPVIVPAEYNGKFEEQFIFYLQHREDNEVETEDDKGLPDPNETPLKDLIEANSPFVLEMLESIDSPLANGMMTNELDTAVGIEASDESGKENEDQTNEPTNVVKELAKIVTELSEDLKTSGRGEIDDDTLTLLSSKKYCENSKKDRRKQTLDSSVHESSEEVDIAVQTLIEEDERSRTSSNNDDEIISRNNINHKQIIANNISAAAVDGKNGNSNTVIGYGEDDCTIIE